MRTARPGPRPRRVLGALGGVVRGVALGLALALTGCANVQSSPQAVAEPAPPPAAQPSARPPGAVPESWRAQRQTYGGLCAQGPCGSTLVVRSDGTWRLRTEGRTAEGVLDDAELDRLGEAVASTGLASPADPATACAADSDGTSVSYAWAADGQAHKVDSCEVVVRTEDPLVRALEELAARLGG
jgi:hypothetical protein